MQTSTAGALSGLVAHLTAIECPRRCFAAATRMVADFGGNLPAPLAAIRWAALLAAYDAGNRVEDMADENGITTGRLYRMLGFARAAKSDTAREDTGRPDSDGGPRETAPERAA